MKTLVLLDLDRTSFRTDLHFDDFCALIERRFNIDLNILKEHEHRLSETPGPYSPIDDLRYSDQLSVDPVEVLETATRELANEPDRYLFDDVKPFLEWQKQQNNDVVLITVGTHEYQEHKRKLVPMLQGYPIIITREAKATVLNRILIFDDAGVKLENESHTLRADRAMLIDDRAGTFKSDMPRDDRLELIRIRRPDVEHSETPTPRGIREITTLTELIT